MKAPKFPNPKDFFQRLSYLAWRLLATENAESSSSRIMCVYSQTLWTKLTPGLKEEDNETVFPKD